MIFLISIFWFIISTKKLLFWIWLWQLKEYHFGRFKAHFQTQKGKKIILNGVFLIKVSLFLLNFIFPQWKLSHFVFYVFLAEAIFAVNRFLDRTLKVPILTKKTSLIFSGGISLEFLFLSYLFGLSLSWEDFVIYLLGFDILSPLIFSIVVLSFHPLSIIWRQQLIKKAQDKRKRFENLLVIGITGSYGKTSTKEFLSTILSEKFKVLKTKEHQNSEVGISQCIVTDLNQEHEIFVCEMGAYNKGGIKLLCDIANPKIGIITGITYQHLATFGSLENIISTKFELIESLPEDGIAFLNYDDKFVRNQNIKKINPKLNNINFYSLNQKGCEIFAQNIKVEKEKLSFEVKTKDGEKENFEVKLLGEHNIPNLLASIICAKSCGMSLKEISKASQKIKCWQSGMELKKGEGGINIIDSTYSSNPKGVISHLEYLKLWKGKRGIVMPCIIELGKKGKEIHTLIGKKIGEICDLAIITTKDYFEQIKKGAEKGPRIRKENILFLEKAQEIKEKIKDFSQKEDVILLEGRVPLSLLKILNI